MATPPIPNSVDTKAFPLPFDDNGRQSNQAGYTQQLTVKARVLTNGDIQVINSQNNSFYGTIKKGTKIFDANAGANLSNDLKDQLNKSISEISKNANEELVQNYGYTIDQANNFTGQNVLSSNTGQINTTLINLSSFASAKVRDNFKNSSYPKNRNKEQDYIRFSIKKYEAVELNPTTPTSVSRSKSNPIGSISLPIQPTISDSNTVDWGEDRLNPIQAAGAVSAYNLAKGGNLKDFGKDFIYSLEQSLGIFANKPESDNVRQAIIAYFAGQAVGNQNLLSRINGAVLNPNLELLFQGPQLRNFNFNFQLTPRSKDDVNEVRYIIRTFKQAMAVQKSSAELFLSAPYIFGIEYIFGKNGSNQPYLPLVKDCALTNFSVDYTPDGSYMTYEDGSMTSYRLTMQFQELTPIYEDDYSVIDGNNDDIIGY